MVFLMDEIVVSDYVMNGIVASAVRKWFFCDSSDILSVMQSKSKSFYFYVIISCMNFWLVLVLFWLVSIVYSIVDAWIELYLHDTDKPMDLQITSV